MLLNNAVVAYLPFNSMGALHKITESLNLLEGENDKVDIS